MKTIREIKLEKLYNALRENLANSENELLKLHENFEAGTIQACKVRKEARVKLANFEIDFKRCNSVAKFVNKNFNPEHIDFDVNYWVSRYACIFGI